MLHATIIRAGWLNAVKGGHSSSESAGIVAQCSHSPPANVGFRCGGHQGGEVEGLNSEEFAKYFFQTVVKYVKDRCPEAYKNLAFIKRAFRDWITAWSQYSIHQISALILRILLLKEPMPAPIALARPCCGDETMGDSTSEEVTEHSI